MIRGFGFQPACISRPGGFGKTSRLFQSNKERRVRAIQICGEASERTTCTQLLWWISKTKRNIKSKGGEKKMGLLVECEPALCLAPRRWAAWWYGSLAGISSFYAPSQFFVHSVALFPRLIALAFVSLELLNNSLLFFFLLHLPHWCFRGFVAKPSSCVSEAWERACFYSTSYTTRQLIHCFPDPDWKVCSASSSSNMAFHHKHVLKRWCRRKNAHF